MVNPSVRAWGYKLLSAKKKNFDKLCCKSSSIIQQAALHSKSALLLKQENHDPELF